MKGMVFTLFNELVEQQFGMDTWEHLLDKVKPKSEGIYTAGESYDDAELMALVTELSAKTKIPASDLVRAFGKFMFPNLASKYPIFLQGQPTLKDFLKTVHDVIHVEVRKLFPEASLPVIEYEDPSPKALVILYRSPRKMCHLSEGLIEGAAEHFNTSVTINHPLCMHNGASHCRLELAFS